jgi:hypothetical protein
MPAEVTQRTLWSHPAEYEVNGRKHLLVPKDLDHLLAPRRVHPAIALPGAGDALVLPSPAPPPPVLAGAQFALLQGDQVRVGDRTAALVDVHRVELVADQVELLQRDRTLLLDDHPGRAPEGRQPLSELLGVGHRGRQAHHGHRQREVDQDFFPHGASIGVLEVVDLVHDHDIEVLEGGAPLVQHVPEHLRGHDHDGGLAVDRVVAGQEPHAAGSVLGHEIPELLVGQRLERRGVERLPSSGQGSLDGELGHHRLAGARRGGHQHGLARLQRADRPHLILVQSERVPRCEPLHVHRFDCFTRLASNDARPPGSGDPGQECADGVGEAGRVLEVREVAGVLERDQL